MDINYTRYEGMCKYQEDILDCESQFSYTLSANKVGKTWSHMVWLFEKAIESDSGHFSWIAPTYKIASIAFDLCCDFIRDTNISQYCKVNLSKLLIKLPNNSIIRFIGAEKTDYIFGYENIAAVMDEASRCSEDSYEALMTTLYATNGQVRFIGNPTIRNNWFFKIWEKIYNLPNHTNGRETSFKLTAHHAIAAGIMKQDFFNFCKKTYTVSRFKRCLLAEVPDGEVNVFKYDKVMENIIKEPIDNSLNKARYIGIDLGFTENGVKSDYTVVIGLDKNCRVVFYKRFQLSGQELIDKLKAYIGNHIAYIDHTGGGITIYELLKKDCHNLEAFTFTNSSKVLCIENLAHYIHSNIVSYPNIDNLINELNGYEIDVTPKGKQTYSNNHTLVSHDDSVIALGLAVLKYKEKEDQGPEYSFEITEIGESYDDDISREAGWTSISETFDYNNIF